MEDVGESGARNREFQRKFTREALIRGLVEVRNEDPIILDVGAHKGESAKFLRRLFPKALIHSFEPSTSSFTELQSHSDERMKCYNIALTDVDGQINFFANEISHTNSVFRVNTGSRDSLYFEERRLAGKDVPYSKFNSPQEVQSRRLADFCELNGISHIDLLKIDVQGAEWKVLTGAAQALEFTDNIILEIMFFDYYEHQGSFMEIESLLYPVGFRLFAISEISNNPMNGRTDWVEVIYRRTAKR